MLALEHKPREHVRMLREGWMVLMAQAEHGREMQELWCGLRSDCRFPGEDAQGRSGQISPNVSLHSALVVVFVAPRFLVLNAVLCAVIVALGPVLDRWD